MNTTGKIFRITNFGESHGPGVGVVIDGCPAGVEWDEDYLAWELSRRRPGQSALTTRRTEEDRPQTLSGVFEGYTTGAPIALFSPNRDARPRDYDPNIFRPSHADYTYHVKYRGYRDWRGGGRASARTTWATVAAGAVAKLLLRRPGVDVCAAVESVGTICMPPMDFDQTQVEASAVRCPHPETAEQMTALIKEVRKAGDAVGGCVVCRIKNVPPGWGEPVYDKLHAALGKAVLNINACKGFEIGSGFAGTRLRSSEHNDVFFVENGRIRTRTNRSGGVLGGISNGEEIYFRAAFKPVATIAREQPTIDAAGNEVVYVGRGRHDPCVLPRAVPVVEAAAAVVLADFFLRYRAKLNV
jgi:chorismate synthase